MTPLDKCIRRATGHASGQQPLFECAERLPERDKLEAERIVKAFAKATGRSVEVELNYVFDPAKPLRVQAPVVVMRNRFKAAVLMTEEADTIGGAWALCCMRLAKVLGARTLAELLVKVDLGAG